MGRFLRLWVVFLAGASWWEALGADNGLTPTPADGAMVSVPLNRLQWSAIPTARRYQIFYGGSRTLIEAAGPNSIFSLGTTTNSEITLKSAPTPGRRHHWRVDVIEATKTNRGPVWAFDVPGAVAVPAEVSVRAILNGLYTKVSLEIRAGTNVAWSLKSNRNWFQAIPSQGIGPANVEASFYPQGLPEGNYTGEFLLTAGELSLPVPVKFSVERLNLTKMVTDFARPYVYAIHAPPDGVGNHLLLFINTDSEFIDHTLPIGNQPTDIAVHRIDSRLYVADAADRRTFGFDLNTHEALPPLMLGTNISRLNAGGSGRLVTEGLGEWVQISSVKLTNALEAITIGEAKSGDGESSPDGRHYFHTDFNPLFEGVIHKYDVTANPPIRLAMSGPQQGGSRNLVMSGDGFRLFWCGRMYDDELQEVRNLEREVYATTRQGEIAFTEQAAVSTVTGATLYEFPFPTKVTAVSGRHDKVFRFNPADRSLRATSMSAIRNSPPLVRDVSVTGLEDSVIKFRLQATDPENEPLTPHVDAPSVGVMSTDGTTWTYWPPANFSGTVSFGYRFSDPGKTSAPAHITITVTPVNDAPVAHSQSLRVNKGDRIATELRGTDVDSPDLSFSILAEPAHGRLTGTPPLVVYEPDAGFAGVDEFQFVVRDGELSSAPAPVRIEVKEPACQPPNPNLVHCWRGEGDLEDAVSGYGLGSVKPVQFAAGKVGQSFLFNGDNRLSVFGVPGLVLSPSDGGFTFEAWIKPAVGGPEQQTLIEFPTFTDGSGVRLQLAAGAPSLNRWAMSLRCQDDNLISIALTDWIVTGGVFQHVAVAYEGFSDTFSVYLNGSIVGTAKAAARLARIGGAVQIGGSGLGIAEQGFVGAIDEVAIHARALTFGEIFQTVAADSGGFCFDPRPPAIVKRPADVSLERGKSFTLSADATGPGPLHFQWRRNGRELIGATNRTLTLTLGDETAGYYTFTASNPYGNTTTSFAKVAINLLINGGFERGNLTGWEIQDIDSPLIPLKVVNTHALGFGFFRAVPTEGSFCLVSGWDGGLPGAISLAQDVSLPAGGGLLDIDYRAAWNLAEFGAGQARTFSLRFEPAGGGAPFQTFPFLIAPPGTATMDTGVRTIQAVIPSGLGGQRVRLNFVWDVPEPGVGPAQFELDHVRVTSWMELPVDLRPDGLSRLADGRVRLEFVAFPLGPLVVMGSANMIDWVRLGTATDIGNNRFGFSAAADPGESLQFFQVITE